MREKAPSQIASRWVRAGIGAAVGATAGFALKDLDLPELVSYGGDREPLVIVAALVGALLWQTSLRKWLGAGTVALAALWCFVAFTPFCTWMGEDLPRQDTVESADAVVVLSSSRRSDESGGFNRLLRGIELLSEGRAPRLVISEPAPPVKSYTADARELMGRLKLGQELVVLGAITNTRDEAVKVGQLFREKGWKMAIVVTSATHSRRASGALEHEGVDVISSPSTDYRFDLRALHSWRDRLAAFGTVMHEWLGIWLYHRRGWLPSAAV